MHVLWIRSARMTWTWAIPFSSFSTYLQKLVSVHTHVSIKKWIYFECTQVQNIVCTLENSTMRSI
jgi:hypothetical protein